MTTTKFFTLDFILDDTNNVLFSVLDRYNASYYYVRFESTFTAVIATPALRQYADDCVRRACQEA